MSRSRDPRLRARASPPDYDSGRDDEQRGIVKTDSSATAAGIPRWRYCWPAPHPASALPGSRHPNLVPKAGDAPIGGQSSRDLPRESPQVSSVVGRVNPIRPPTPLPSRQLRRRLPTAHSRGKTRRGDLSATQGHLHYGLWAPGRQPCLPALLVNRTNPRPSSPSSPIALCVGREAGRRQAHRPAAGGSFLRLLGSRSDGFFPLAAAVLWPATPLDAVWMGRRAHGGERTQLCLAILPAVGGASGGSRHALTSRAAAACLSEPTARCTGSRRSTST